MNATCMGRCGALGLTSLPQRLHLQHIAVWGGPNRASSTANSNRSTFWTMCTPGIMHVVLSYHSPTLVANLFLGAILHAQPSYLQDRLVCKIFDARSYCMDCCCGAVIEWEPLLPHHCTEDRRSMNGKRPTWALRRSKLTVPALSCRKVPAWKHRTKAVLVRSHKY
jgi:hypothetical protein